MQTQLLSFHGDPAIKEKYIKRLQLHYDLDEIIKGQYWEGGKGCAVGCTVHSGKHDSFESELGITWRLALLEDSLFEKLPNEDAKEFPLQFLKAIPVGIDTNVVFKKFIIWNLADETEGLIYHIKDKEQIALLKEVADTYQKSFTEDIPQKTWVALAQRANNAYASAYASAYAYAYAYASASASAYAYASASASAYASASGSIEWQKKFDERVLRMRDKLLELLIASGNGEIERKNITKELAVLPVNETSDLKNPASKPNKNLIQLP